MNILDKLQFVAKTADRTVKASLYNNDYSSMAADLRDLCEQAAAAIRERDVHIALLKSCQSN